MRSKNSKPIDDDEAEWLADVKSVPCVFCDAMPPVEAHHPKQGLHFGTVAACKPCHDARVWRIGGMTEQEAANETTRRVVRMRAGKRILIREPRAWCPPVSKIVPRREA